MSSLPLSLSPYEAKNFDHLLGTPGFSDALLKNHFTLYQGYVANTNKLSEMLTNGSIETGTPQYAELKRRFGWEFNGMRLHELYFGNMKNFSQIQNENAGGKMNAEKITEKTVKEWGSMEAWEKDFKATGAMRGIGWVILAHDAVADRLFNVWVNEHDAGHLAGCVPLLVMDVFEHAFMPDYGLKRADYIEAFWKAIDWGAVGARL